MSQETIFCESCEELTFTKDIHTCVCNKLLCPYCIKIHEREGCSKEGVNMEIDPKVPEEEPEEEEEKTEEIPEEEEG